MINRTRFFLLEFFGWSWSILLLFYFTSWSLLYTFMMYNKLAFNPVRYADWRWAWPLNVLKTRLFKTRHSILCFHFSQKQSIACCSIENCGVNCDIYNGLSRHFELVLGRWKSKEESSIYLRRWCSRRCRGRCRGWSRPSSRPRECGPWRTESHQSEPSPSCARSTQPC